MAVEFPRQKIGPGDTPAEITVEGELWTGLAVVADTHERPGASGSYGLVQASEGPFTGAPEEPERQVTVWKGPEKPDLRVWRRNLVQMDCRTVLIDENGFYTCPPIIDLVKDAVLEIAPKLFDEEANKRFAESLSYVDREEAADRYDTEDVLAIAVIGDVIAVNGEETGRKPKIPRGWTEIKDIGGRILGGDEEEIDLDWISEYIARELTKTLKRPIDKEMVETILHKEYGGTHGYITWGADSGDTSVYVPKKAVWARETDLDRKHRLQDEANERQEKERKRLWEESIKKAREEARAKLQRGGYPKPTDWSPKGELP